MASASSGPFPSTPRKCGFDDGQRTVEPASAGLEPAEPQVAVSGLSQPLALFVQETAAAAVQALGLEKPESFADQCCTLAQTAGWCCTRRTRRCRPRKCRWKFSSTRSLMVRNNLRVLEQKD